MEFITWWHRAHRYSPQELTGLINLMLTHSPKSRQEAAGGCSPLSPNPIHTSKPSRASRDLYSDPPLCALPSRSQQAPCHPIGDILCFQFQVPIYVLVQA